MLVEVSERRDGRIIPESVEMIATVNYYYQVDTLGSVREAANAKGSLLFATNYEPYGPLSGASGADLLQYTGKMLDSNIGGLYNFGSRYYDPSTGRFITEDTSMGELTDPLSQNRYIYAADNPEKYIDPTGHRFETSSGGGGSSTTPPPTPHQEPPPPSHGVAPPPTPPLPSSGQTGTSSSTSSSSSSASLTATQTSSQTTMVTHSTGGSSVTTSTTAASETTVSTQSQGPIPGTTVNEGLSITFVVGAWFLTGTAIFFTGGAIMATPVGVGMVFGDMEASAEVAADGTSANPGKTDQAFVAGFIEGFSKWWDFAGPF